MCVVVQTVFPPEKALWIEWEGPHEQRGFLQVHVPISRLYAQGSWRLWQAQFRVGDRMGELLQVLGGGPFGGQ